MKIICDSCGAKYSIADEKVQGKVFKIRCKKCSEVIVVEGTDDAGAEAHDGYDSAYEGGGAAEWYVVIDGERVGPVTAEEVDGYFDSGQLHAESYVWKEGMDDWVMLETVSGFAHLFEEAAGPSEETMVADQSGRPVSGQQAHVGAQHDSGAHSEQQQYAAGADSGGYDEMDYAEPGDATAVMDSGRFDEFDGDDQLDETDVNTTGDSGDYAAVEGGSYDDDLAGGLGAGGDAAVADGVAGTDDADQGGMFAAFDAEEEEDYDDGGAGFGGVEEDSPDLSDPDNDLVGARNENSVLFSLSNVDESGASSSDQSSGREPGQAQGNDKSGLIDIQSLASTHAAMKGDGDDGDVDEEFVANTMSMPALTPSSSSRSSNKGLIVAVAVAAVLAAALSAVVVILLLDDDDEPAVEETVVAQQEVDAQQDDEPAEQQEEVDEELAAAQEAAEAAKAVEDGDDEDDAEAEAQAEAEAEADDEPEQQEERAVARRDEPSSSDDSGGSTGGGGTASPDRDRDRGSGGTGTGSSGTSDRGGSGGSETEETDNDSIAGRLDRDGSGSQRQQQQQQEEAAAEDLPDRLSRSMVQDTIRRYMSRVNDCAENSNPDGLTGNAMVRFEVLGSGNVRTASAQDQFASTEVGSCIEGVVESMQFPETRDDARTINFPFTVR